MKRWLWLCIILFFVDVLLAQVKLINKKGKLKCSVLIDELPAIYFRVLDNLIATARRNKVAVCLGFQDFSQLTRDYGDKESKVIRNTVGNISVVRWLEKQLKAFRNASVKYCGKAKV